MKTTNKNLFNLTVMALFTAIILIMNFTPIGYITTGAFSITLMILPVAVGAICLGIKGGIYLGALFGLTSFLMCFGIGFMIDPTAATMFQESPIATIITCFVPRILAGLITSLVFTLFKKFGKINILAFALSCACMPILNTVLFLSSFALTFRNTALAVASVKALFMTAISLNGLIELSVTLIVGTAVCKAVYRYTSKLQQS